jgi:hypothetical protein
MISDAEKLRALADWMQKHWISYGTGDDPFLITAADIRRIADRLELIDTEAVSYRERTWDCGCGYTNIGPICTKCCALPGKGKPQ